MPKGKRSGAERNGALKQLEAGHTVADVTNRGFSSREVREFWIPAMGREEGFIPRYRARYERDGIILPSNKRYGHW